MENLKDKIKNRIGYGKLTGTGDQNGILLIPDHKCRENTFVQVKYLY